jgi:WD40 repeat protein
VATQDIFTVSFSPDGKRIAAASGRFGRDLTAVKIWDVSTGQEVLTIRGHSADEWFHGVAFAPAGERITSLGIDGKVTFWDTTAGAEVLTLSGHTDWVLHAAFSRDGNYLATGGRDHRVILWNATPLAATR